MSQDTSEVVIDRGKSSWSDLWKAEDYWAIWIGLILLAWVSVLVYNGRADIDKKYNEYAAVMKTESSKPFKTVEYLEAQAHQKGLEAAKVLPSVKNFVAKLKCGIDEADPCEVMHQQLDKLAAKEWPDRDKSDDKPRGRVLLDEKGAFCAVDVKRGVISIHLDIDLSESCDYGKKIANFIINSNKCLYSNQDLVRRAARATAKPSNK